jgi:regulator of protease activity HflC (stomatin/prohibitin superfamily)
MGLRLLLAVMLVGWCAGCGAVIEPGHRGLLFDPRRGGLQREVLMPGQHSVGLSGHIEDFDITYSTRREPLHAITQEGLTVDLSLAIIYRPIISELYELDSEIGRNYYDEVVGPELRSAARGVVATHSYTELPKRDAGLENEIERTLRARITHRHVEVSAVIVEAIKLAPEVEDAVRGRLAAEQKARREKMEADRAWERERIELERNVERRRLQRAAEGP